ncbi:MAG: tripartite tricarboxylate transporter TctB family protein [Thermodesulfobacteriota bacterium]
MKKNDLIAGGLFIALGLFIFTQTSIYPSLEKGHPGPDLFPNILAILFIVFGFSLIFKSRKHLLGKTKPFPSTPKRLSNAFFVIGIIVAYVAIVNKVGFLITSGVLLFILMKKLGVTLLKSVITSILFTLFINLLFSKILRVPLPYGILGW